MADFLLTVKEFVLNHFAVVFAVVVAAVFSPQGEAETFSGTRI